MLMIWFNRASDITTASGLGVAPPESPVPAPPAMTGTRAFAQVRSTATTSASSAGSATASGRQR